MDVDRRLGYRGRNRKRREIRDKGGYSNMLEISIPLHSLVHLSTFFSPVQVK